MIQPEDTEVQTASPACTAKAADLLRAGSLVAFPSTVEQELQLGRVVTGRPHSY